MSAPKLEDRKARELPKGTPPLTETQIREYRREVPEWTAADGRLTREFRLRDFRQALAFVNRVGELAERENHHPDISIHGWNRVTLTLSTHSVGGLSENDFILAAKVNRLGTD
jgi:4a-hydroxytetrahydrobiopterin dehydratase